MELINSLTDDKLIFRHPRLEDGYAIYQLIKRCPPLDLNSSYLYFLQADHFSDTCLIAQYQDKTVGCIWAYKHPKNNNQLFVWQVAVDATMRGKQVGSQLLEQLVIKQSSHGEITSLSATISPSNVASQKLFERFAKRYSCSLNKQPYLMESHFGDLGHEAEDLYVIAALENQSLTQLITNKI
jgi:L-2,4-diaminobutyric acid acetyltransferase